MTDMTAFVILIICGAILLIAKFLTRGDYEDQIPLSPGQYLVGYDIDPGKCDLKAASGGGNFIVHNKVAKAWQIGSNIGVTSGIQPSRFRNLVLLKGDVLEINGNVTVLLTPPVPIEDPSEEPLGLGIYRFGVDVPVGRYDLEIVSGDGDVLLVEVKKDRYNFYQDMSLENPLKADSFTNIVCTDDFELWVNGDLQVKLNPSKRRPWCLKRLLKKQSC